MALRDDGGGGSSCRESATNIDSRQKCNVRPWGIGSVAMAEGEHSCWCIKMTLAPKRPPHDCWIPSVKSLTLLACSRWYDNHFRSTPSPTLSTLESASSGSVSAFPPPPFPPPFFVGKTMKTPGRAASARGVTLASMKVRMHCLYEKGESDGVSSAVGREHMYVEHCACEAIEELAVSAV